MDELMTHLNTRLNTVVDLKTVEEDMDQIEEDNITLRVPAVYYDVDDMAYSQAGEHIGLADTQITIRLALAKRHTNKFALINAITTALVGTHGDSFSQIIKESFQKRRYKDCFEYRITFGCIAYDESARPSYTQLDEKPEPNFVVKKK